MRRGPPPESLPAKTHAQRRADRIRAFRDELAQIEFDGVLNLADEQRRRLLRYHQGVLLSLSRRYDVDTTPAERQISLGMKAAAGLGVFALAAAAAFFLHSFWGILPTSARLAALALPSLGATLGTGYAAGSSRLSYWAPPLGLAAFASFTGGLWLMASALNVPSSPLILLSAGAFALALAYGCGLRSLLALGLAGTAAFGSCGAAALLGLDWTVAPLRPEGLAAAGLAILLTSALVSHESRPGFPQVYRAVGLVLLLAPAAMLSVWGQGSLLPLSKVQTEALYQAAGLSAAAAAFGAGLWRRQPETVHIGASALLILLCAILYDWWWASLPRYLFFFALAAAALALVAALQGLRAMSRPEEP